MDVKENPVDPDATREADPQSPKEESRARETRLEATEYSLQMILDAIPSWVFLKDDKNYILQVNQAVLDQLGCSREEIEGTHAKQHFPDQADRYYQDDLAVLKSGKPKLGYVEPFLDRWIHTDKIPLANSQGEFDRILAVATDITELRRATESAKSLQRMMDKASEMARLGGWELDLLHGSGPIWSPEVCRIHEVPIGHTPTTEEALGYYSADDTNMVSDCIDRAIRLHEPWDFKARIITAKGNERHVRAIGEPEIIDGKCVKLWGTFQDITAEMQARQALAESDERLTMAMQNGNLGLWDWDVETNKVVFSEVTKTQLGYPADADWNCFNDWESRLHPDDREEALKRARALVSQPQETYDSTFRLRTATGGYRWIRAVGRGGFDEAGTLKRCVGVHLDVTETVEAQTELLRSEERYRTLYEESPLMHANIDPETAAVKDCNRLLVERLGYAKKSDIIGMPVFSLYHESCHDEVREAFDQFLATGRVDNRELSLVTRAGSRIPVILNVAAVRDSRGKIVHSSSTWSDVTELRKYTNEIEQANAELEQFAYVASHDLKAPLRAIDHIASWLSEDLAGQLPEASEKHLTQLKQRVSRMEKLLDDLLAYSRAGRLRGEVSSIDLADLVRESLQLLNLPDDFVVTCNLEVQQIVGHWMPLDTIIRNLIGNAVKHHDRGKGEILVSTAVAPNQAGMLLVTVADNGPGIDTSLRNRAFGMFQTLQPRDEVEGSGMGLALVKKLVEAEGGKVWIDSNQPRGTQVCFTWPQTVD